MRSVISKDSEQRESVKEYNKTMKGNNVKLSRSTIWNDIRTGKTSPRELMMINVTHPNVRKAIKLCIHFCDMIHVRDGALQVVEWIKDSQACTATSLMYCLKGT